MITAISIILLSLAIGVNIVSIIMNIQANNPWWVIISGGCILGIITVAIRHYDSIF